MFTYLLVAPESNALFFHEQDPVLCALLTLLDFSSGRQTPRDFTGQCVAGDRTTTTADRYRSLYKHSSAALIGGLTVGLVGALAFLFAVVIVCRRRNKRARTPPPPPSNPAQDPSVLYHNNAVFMVPNVACMSPSLGYTNTGYTNMGYTSCGASSPPAYATLQFSTLAAQPSGQTGPPNTLAAQPSEKTGPPSSMAAQPSGENGPPNSVAAQPIGQTGPPQTGPSETMSV